MICCLLLTNWSATYQLQISRQKVTIHLHFVINIEEAINNICRKFGKNVVFV